MMPRGPGAPVAPLTDEQAGRMWRVTDDAAGRTKYATWEPGRKQFTYHSNKGKALRSSMAQNKHKVKPPKSALVAIGAQIDDEDDEENTGQVVQRPLTKFFTRFSPRRSSSGSSSSEQQSVIPEPLTQKPSPCLPPPPPPAPVHN